MKGNDGRAARRKAARRMVLVGSGGALACFVVLFAFGFIGIPLSSRNGHHDSRLLRDPNSAAKRHHEDGDPNSQHGFREYLQEQFVGSKKKDQAQVLQQVLAAELQLVDLTVVEEELLRSPPNSYAGVYGKFCKLDWTLRKKDPSAVPMFRNLVQQSLDCKEHQYTLNLKHVADLARHQDEINGATSTSTTTPKVLNFTLATFHESRCGSTLVANAVAAMDSVKHRSYSEAQPPSSALLQVCGRNFSRCTLEQAALVLKDVIYLMSRSNDPLEERVFFKFQSATTHSLKVFQQAFPQQPWMFVYRDPVPVMMSHIKDDPLLQGKANCMRSHINPPPEIQALASRHGYSSARALSMEEYCAAHLAAITESAVASLAQDEYYGIPVNYELLPDYLYTTVLPRILGRSLAGAEIQNIQAISQHYSKGTGAKHGEFQQDSQAKVNAASPTVKAAALKFLQPSFEQLSQHRAKILLETAVA